MDSIRNITLLGATGSIGRSTLKILSDNRQLYRIFAVSAHQNMDFLLEICHQFHPKIAVVSQETQAIWLRERLSGVSTTEVWVGQDALCQIASDPSVDMVLAAITGTAGLPSVMAAAKAGKTILLANKESLVVAGALLLDTLKHHKGTLLPVDSEHNAIFQVLPSDFQIGVLPASVEKILLTASGGPFWQWTLNQMEAVTPEQACRHPRWNMGAKISVDSATMVNKGLELIEACWLFGAKPSQIEILIHPQSIVHSMVEMKDGSVLAQLGPTDMRIPISYCLGWPKRLPNQVPRFSWSQGPTLEFFQPDDKRFPAIKAAENAFLQGQGMTCVYNAANEVAVSAFLSGRLSFLSIYPLIESMMMRQWPLKINNLSDLLELDKQVRLETAARLESVCV